MISPDQFIPLAERSGLINLLSMWVLKTALHQVADWKRMGLAMPVSVNLSARDLIDVRLPDEIEAALHEDFASNLESVPENFGRSREHARQCSTYRRWH